MGAVSDDDRKAAAEAAIDLLVYAPLGFALEARGLLPKFVERGRNQVTMARMIGQFAVQQGKVEAGKRLGPAQEQAVTLLADLGVLPRTDGPAGADGPGAGPATDRGTPVAPVDDVDDVERIEVVVEDEPAPPSDPVPAVADLAIPDYDSLAASQVVPRLRALTGDELEAVRAYEAAGRGRKTILNRVAQLQSGV